MASVRGTRATALIADGMTFISAYGMTSAVDIWSVRESPGSAEGTVGREGSESAKGMVGRAGAALYPRSHSVSRSQETVVTRGSRTALLWIVVVD